MGFEIRTKIPTGIISSEEELMEKEIDEGATSGDVEEMARKTMKKRKLRMKIW